MESFTEFSQIEEKPAYKSRRRRRIAGYIGGLTSFAFLTGEVSFGIEGPVVKGTIATMFVSLLYSVYQQHKANDVLGNEYAQRRQVISEDLAKEVDEFVCRAQGTTKALDELTQRIDESQINNIAMLAMYDCSTREHLKTTADAIINWGKNDAVPKDVRE